MNIEKLFQLTPGRNCYSPRAKKISLPTSEELLVLAVLEEHLGPPKNQFFGGVEAQIVLPLLAQGC